MRNNKMLFLDDEYIEKSCDVERTFYRWEKEKGNPLITKKYDWEGMGPYGFGIASSESPYKAWYGTYGGKENDYPSGFFVSEDGLSWDGERIAINSIDKGAQAALHIEDKGQNFGEYKYLGITIYRKTEEIPFLHTKFIRSKDAIDWESFPKDPHWIGPSDVISVRWDDNIQKYVTYYKLWKVEGEEVNGEPFLSYFPSFLPTIKGDTFRAQGFAVLPERKDIDVMLRYGGGVGQDDGGGGYVDELVTMIRVIARAESSDFVHWENEAIIIEPPEDAPLGDQSYGMNIQLYNGMYIGIYNHFNALEGKINPMLAWSYNGIDFNVNFDSLLLECSEEGWDAGMILASTFYENLNDRMCLYYGGVNQNHKVTDLNINTGAIGRAWMRKDGFASISKGSIVTKPILIDFNKFVLNMKGEVVFKLLDLENNILDETKLSGDNTNNEVDINLDKYIGKELKVLIDLKNGEIYSLSNL